MSETRVGRLIEFTVLRDGAEMHCSYRRALPRDNVEREIVAFQERHFRCDPHAVDMPQQRRAIVTDSPQHTHAPPAAGQVQ